jgi:HEAT repeat protein
MNSRLTLAVLLCGAFSGFASLAAKPEDPPADATLSRLREKLKSGLIFSGRLAVEQLGKLGPSAASATPDLILVLADSPDPMTRIRVAWALGEIREPVDQVGPALIAALADPEPGVRTSAVMALIRCGEPILPENLLALKSANDLIRLGAAEVQVHLSKDKTELPVPVLSGMMSHPDAQIRLRAIRCLEIIGKPANTVAPALLGSLEDETTEVRIAAVRALGVMDVNDGAINAIAGLLKSDSSKHVRVNAAEILGIVGLKSSVALETLVEAFADADDRTRARVVESVAKFGAAAIPKVLAAAKKESPHDVVRRSALDSLIQMGPIAAPAVDELLAYLAADGSWQVRHGAAAALGASGVAEPSVLAGLKRAMEHDPNPDVRLVAETAVKGLATSAKANRTD